MASVLLLASGLAYASNEQHRNFDARALLNKGLTAKPSAEQVQAAEALRRDMPDLAVSFDDATGAARSVWNQVGYLTAGGSSTADTKAIGLEFVSANLGLFGLTPEDLAELEVTDSVATDRNGVTHVYLRQVHKGLPLYNGQLQFNVAKDGRIVSINNLFLPRLAQGVNTTTPKLSAAEAIASATRHLGWTDAARDPGSSPVPDAKLMLLPVRAGMARLVWNFQLQDDDHWYDLTVDAVDGKVWTRFDWVADATYKVYQQPVESPQHTTPLPPADGRVVLTDPWNLTASPYGWHDTNGAAGAEYTITRGNNVHAWEDSDGNNSEPPPAGETECGGGINCDFPIDLTQAPSAYRPAAVANLFYWNNIIHDVQYQYGFNEVAGNFQSNNYGNGGLGNDWVRALAQSGAGTCNANFATPPDGSTGRMRMYICGNVTPAHDGDLDNFVIVHEFGHGISNRLVGGPGNTSCLGNTQQPGEGLSDWWGLAYTAKASDTGPQGRGAGTYLVGQPPDGPGIRPFRYSTDNAVNPDTYASVAGRAVPHGVGAVWAQGYWEVYWELVSRWGFDSNIYNAGGSAGNQRAMLYINEGLKNTICSPAFTDVRDGIIQAATALHSGEDVCRIWKAFAAFGLGSNAVSGGPNSTTPTNGFQVPSACMPATPASLTATPNGSNRVDVAWDTASGAQSYNLYRTIGSCPQTVYTLIASGLTSTAYSDLTVSGGTTYAYAVAAVNDVGIEGAKSNCDDAAATGACTLAPTFAGLTSVTNPGNGTCALDLSWTGATQNCGSGVVYNIYRSTSSTFTPDATNRIAKCVTGTTFRDINALAGADYYYVVRAEDNSGNGTGACNGGNEETNTARKLGDPDVVPAFSDDIESGSGLWTTDGTGGTPWSIVTTASQSPTHSWFSDDPTFVKDQRVSWASALAVPSAGPILSFWHQYALESSWDGGVLEYSTDGGTTWFDILAGNGGSIPANPNRFTQNGYTGTLSASSNPIATRLAWTGSATTFREVRVDMADFGLASVRLRWRCGSDASVGGQGWWVDDVKLNYNLACAPSDLIFKDGFQ